MNVHLMRQTIGIRTEIGIGILTTTILMMISSLVTVEASL